MIGSVTSIPFDPIAAGITPAPQKSDANPTAGTATTRPGASDSSNTNDKPAATTELIGSTKLTDEEQKEVEQLKARDREVRQHEQAHLRAAGNLALGGPQYSYTTGPDGRRYVTDGSVSIDTSKEAEPEQNVRKGDRIVKAALAPAEPSPQDLEVAAKGRQMKLEALSEIRTRRQEEVTSNNEEGNATPIANAANSGSGASASDSDNNSSQSVPSRVGPDLDAVRTIYEGVANNSSGFSPVSTLKALATG